VYRYNGTGAAAADYADRVFLQATDPAAEAAVFMPWAPTLRTPTQVFAEYTTARQFQARATEAVLAENDADGTIIRRDATFRPTAPPVADRPPSPRVAADAETPVQVGLQLSRVVFGDDGARHAVLARDDDWADSLAGAGLAGDWGPVLFATGGAAGTLPDATRSELQRVLADGGTVYLLGGTAALSPAVEAAVAAAGLVPQRLAGTDRLTTASTIAREVRRLEPASTEVLVARGYDSPADALTGGAAAGNAHLPLVLTPTASMPQWLRDELAALGPRTAVVLGGTAAVSDTVVEELRATGFTVDRAAGADRYSTAVAIATRLWGSVARDVVAVDLQSSDGWAWALAAGSLSAVADGPQLGVAPDTAPASTLDAIRGAAGTAAQPVRVVVVGSAARATTAVRQSLRAAAQGTG
jgi:putative cell wall-binding protein